MSPLAYQPSAVKARALCSGGPVVAARRVGAAGEQHARLPVGQVAAIGRRRGGPRRRGTAAGPACAQIDLVRVVQPGVVEQALGHAEHLLERRAEDRLDPAGELVGEPGAADLQHLAASAGPARSRRRAASQRWATAGTTAVIVTPSALDGGERAAGSGEASMTTWPPDSSVPRIPGQASGKLCEAGSATRYTVPGPTAQPRRRRGRCRSSRCGCGRSAWAARSCRRRAGIPPRAAGSGGSGPVPESALGTQPPGPAADVARRPPGCGRRAGAPARTPPPSAGGRSRAARPVRPGRGPRCARTGRPARAGGARAAP